MRTIMMFLLAITMIGCQEEKKEPQIRLADYDKPYITEDMKTAEEQDDADKIAVVAEISIEGNDQMAFNKKELRVPAGSTVKLTLKHVGTFPANAMGHNVVVLKKGTDVQTFALNAMKFPDNDYVPKDASNVIAHTKIIGGGESTTIEFKAPPKGAYNFLCSFPGHYAMMQGVLIVE